MRRGWVVRGVKARSTARNPWFTIVGVVLIAGCAESRQPTDLVLRFSDSETGLPPGASLDVEVMGITELIAWDTTLSEPVLRLSSSIATDSVVLEVMTRSPDYRPSRTRIAVAKGGAETFDVRLVPVEPTVARVAVRFESNEPGLLMNVETQDGVWVATVNTPQVLELDPGLYHIQARPAENHIASGVDLLDVVGQADTVLSFWTVEETTVIEVPTTPGHSASDLKEPTTTGEDPQGPVEPPPPPPADPLVYEPNRELGDSAWAAGDCTDVVRYYGALPSPPQGNETAGRAFAERKYRLAECFRRSDNFEAAVQSLHQVLEYDRVQYTAALRLGTIECSLRNYDEGRRWLREVRGSRAMHAPPERRRAVMALALFEIGSCTQSQFEAGGAGGASSDLRISAYNDFATFVSEAGSALESAGDPALHEQLEELIPEARRALEELSR